MVAGAYRGRQGATLPLDARALLRRDRPHSRCRADHGACGGSAVNAQRRILLIVCGLLSVSGPSLADVFRPAYLELRQRDADTFDVLWKVPAIGDSLRLGIHVRFPSDVKNVTEP